MVGYLNGIYRIYNRPIYGHNPLKGNIKPCFIVGQYPDLFLRWLFLQDARHTFLSPYCSFVPSKLQSPAAVDIKQVDL